MHTYRKLVAFCLCVIVMGVLGGCAKPRTGPHDVPSATFSGHVADTKAPDDVRKAATELAGMTIYFDFNKHAIKPEAESTLLRVADILVRFPSIRVCIRGHCDARGSVEYNYQLGERRARAAYGFLVRSGVSPAQLEMVTHGKKSPAATGTSSESMARNRRGEFSVLTTCH